MLDHKGDSLTQQVARRERRVDARAVVDMLTLGDFIDGPYTKHLNIKQKKHRVEANTGTVRKGFPCLLARRLDTIVKQDFIDWISDQKDAGYADATINRKTNGMRGVFSLAVDAEVLAVHPMSQVKKLREPSGIVRFLHDDEDARLHAALDAREHALRVRLDDERAVDELRVKILVSLNTGVRRGELLRLELEHIDLIHRTIAVIDGNAKSGTRRFLPLNGALRLQDDDLTSLAPAEILDLQMRYKAPRPYDASKPIGEQVERADRLQRQTVQLVMERCRTDDELILLRRYLSISPPETKDPV